MRRTLPLFLIVFLVSCSGSGGGGNSAPPPVPTSNVSGAAVDGLIIQGTVRVYDFSGGSQGGLLGSATTDAVGHYSVSIQSESRPVLVEVTGGYYIEEATNTQVPLGSGLKLTALFNHSTGQPVTIAVTAYTHAAAALAQYLMTQGRSVSAAINEANTRFNVWIGHSITNTIPLAITDSGNASAQPTPAHNYGFLAGAISNWTKANRPNGVISHTAPYRSIEFIQKMYDDLRADGLLDGRGASGGALSFGTTPMSVNVYRAELAMQILRIADDPANRTGITSAQLLQYARAYAASVDPIFNNVAPIPIDQPIVSIISPSANQWISGVINVRGVVTDTAGPGTVNLVVDSNTLGMATDYFNPVVSFDTRTLSNSTHAFGFTVTNFVGLSTRTTINALVDNVLPTVVVNSPIVFRSGSPPYFSCTINGAVSDVHSGPVGTVSAVWNKTGGNGPVNFTETVNLVNDTYSVTFALGIDEGSGPFTISVQDNAGNSTVITRMLVAHLGSARSSPYCIFQ